MTKKTKPNSRCLTEHNETQFGEAPTPSAGRSHDATASSSISAFHAHIYFHDKRQQRTAERLCHELTTRFGAEFGMRRELPGGPHPAPMLQLAFGAAMFGVIIPWLMLSREGLDVLVHPVTGADRADHDQHALWLGQKLQINFDRL